MEIREMKWKLLPGLAVFLLLLPYVSGDPWQGYHYYEDDAEGDVVYFSLVPLGYYKGRQFPEIDIRSAEVKEKNGTVDFILRVYGEIRNDAGHKYYFDVFPQYEEEYIFGYTVEFYDGSTSIIYMENETYVDLGNVSRISGDTLTITVPVDMLWDINVDEIHVWAIKTEMIAGRAYTDSTTPLETIAKDEPPILLLLLGPVLIILFVVFIFYFFYGKKVRLFLKGKLKKQCPNCEVIFSRKQKTCTYCGAELK